MDFRRSLQRGIGAQLDNHPEIVSLTKNNWKSYRRFSPDADWRQQIRETSQL